VPTTEEVTLLTPETYSRMNKLCGECALCSDFLPQQQIESRLAWELNRTIPLVEGVPFQEPVVLVLDDCDDKKLVSTATINLWELLGKSIFEEHEVVEADVQVAAERCAVWTNMLLEERLVILATKRGLEQMGVKKEMEEGDMRKSARWGVVLCIPPLHLLSPKSAAFKVYKAKVQRVLKEAGLIT
jgi:hypothetical protein